jgi:Fungal protein kinase
VHRDVSIGNILSCDGHAKLADLEYARKMGDLKSHNTRPASEYSISLSGKSLIASQQGTMQFMSIEVAAQTYLFVPPAPRTMLDDFFSARKQGEWMAQTEVPFSHNHLHDLESLWWVAVWMVFYNYFSEGTPSRDPPSLTLQDAEDLLRLAEILFPPMLSSTGRQIGFQHPTSFLRTCDQLPRNETVIYGGLNHLRQLLISNYSDIEAGYPLSVDPNTSKDDIYDDFTRVFSRLKTVSQDLVLNFIPDIYTKLLKGEKPKHPRPESTNDTGVAQKTARK